jgi:hypothetical protein
MATLEQRVSRLEGAYEHLATKADLKEEIGNLKADLIKWIVGVQMGSLVALAAIVSAVVAVIKLLD